MVTCFIVRSEQLCQMYHQSYFHVSSAIGTSKQQKYYLIIITFWAYGKIQSQMASCFNIWIFFLGFQSFWNANNEIHRLGGLATCWSFPLPPPTSLPTNTDKKYLFGKLQQYPTFGKSRTNQLLLNFSSNLIWVKMPYNMYVMFLVHILWKHMNELSLYGNNK